MTASELAGFKRFCAEILDLRLEPFQVKMAREVFSDRRECLILLARGNGKTTLLAAIGLWPPLASSPVAAVIELVPHDAVASTCSMRLRRTS